MKNLTILMLIFTEIFLSELFIEHYVQQKKIQFFSNY